MSKGLETTLTQPPSLPDYLAACISEADPRTILEQFADDFGMFEAAQ